ncbi:MAG: ABC transporter ATP-binding protein [Spirochaetales bacterium]|nr:MAG: ABC transporter ATP-binding protein [Spirochaetales bacterium]
MPVEAKHLTKTFGDLVVFRDLSFSLPENKVTVLLGPSGCGKTTLLNIISGADRLFEGRLAGAEDHTMSYLFQEPRLLPWKTVRGNLEFVLRHKFSEARCAQVIEHMLELVGLSGFSNYYPDQLSGGMRQRAALARAYAFPGDLILMDEPFQALDLRLKLGLVKTFNRLWVEEPRTAVFVTHDIHEAILLGDVIIVLSDRPASIRRHFSNGVPRSERSLESDEILRLEKDLYTECSL